MRILSVNTAKPKTIIWEGKNIKTSIFKTSVEGPQKVSYLKVGDDTQCELKFHGGRNKAIYSYDYSYYEIWKSKIEHKNWSYGIFGENLTTEGLADDIIKIGNIYQAGSVIFKAIQPRIPCFKLNLPFRRNDMLNMFYNSKNYGTYFRVIKEGNIESGNSIKLIEESTCPYTISDLVEIYATRGKNQQLLINILDSPFFPEEIRQNYTKFLL